MAGSASLLWVVAGIVGLIAVTPELDKAVAPGPAAQQDTGFSIARAPDGQFYAPAHAGGQTLRMMIDPGAPQVLLSRIDAERLGLEVKPGFTPAALPRLRVGPHEVKQVEVVIAPDLPVSLLGDSFLSRLGGIDVRRDRIFLR